MPCSSAFLPGLHGLQFYQTLAQVAQIDKSAIRRFGESGAFVAHDCKNATHFRRVGSAVQITNPGDDGRLDASIRARNQRGSKLVSRSKALPEQRLTRVKFQKKSACGWSPMDRAAGEAPTDFGGDADVRRNAGPDGPGPCRRHQAQSKLPIYDGVWCSVQVELQLPVVL